MAEMRHNINNALTSILGNADLELLEPGLPANVIAQADTIRNMALRLHEIFQRFSSIEKELAVAAHSNGSKSNGRRPASSVMPVTVHTFPARPPIHEPHIVRSLDSIALRPMTIEEAVKEAEFRDREVFMFRDNRGNVKVLHRKRDGKMELIEEP